MVHTSLPTFNMDISETGCCPRFDPTGWDGEEFGRLRLGQDDTSALYT